MISCLGTATCQQPAEITPLPSGVTPSSIKLPNHSRRHWADAYFDANGRYTAPRGSDGLTCATFISEIFRAVGLPLVQLDTWEARDQDLVWGNDVCALLKHRGGASDEHIEAVRSSINGLRLRPEELAFSADLPSLARPVAFAEASVGGVNVMNFLNAECPRRLPSGAGPVAAPVVAS